MSPRTHPQRVSAALEAMVTAHTDELAARDALIADLRRRNTELVTRNDNLRRSVAKMKTASADMQRRLASLRHRFGVLAVDTTPDDDVIPAGKGSHTAVAAQLEITPADVRAIAAGIDPHHVSMAVIRRARTLLNRADAA